MDIFVKVLGISVIGVILCLILSKNGKDFAVVISILSCCIIVTATVSFLDPVIQLIDKIRTLASMKEMYLGILLKAVGISFLGDTVSTVCCDAGYASIGKTLSFMTTVVVLWISLPLINGMLDLVSSVLEMA